MYVLLLEEVHLTLQSLPNSRYHWQRCSIRLIARREVVNRSRDRKLGGVASRRQIDPVGSRWKSVGRRLRQVWPLFSWRRASSDGQTQPRKRNREDTNVAANGSTQISWCYVTDNRPVISQCSALRHFHALKSVPYFIREAGWAAATCWFG